MIKKFVIEFEEDILLKNVEPMSKEQQVQFLYDLWLDNPHVRIALKLQRLEREITLGTISNDTYVHLKSLYESQCSLLTKLEESVGLHSIYIEDCDNKES